MAVALSMYVLKLPHTGLPPEKLWLYCRLHWNTSGRTITAHTPRTHAVKQRCIHVSLKWQDGGTPSNKWTDLCKFSFYFEYTALQRIPVLQHNSVHAFGMSTIIAFVHLGLQFKWNQLSPNNSRHTRCIHKRLHAGKWPDLLISKPDAFSTLGYHWADYTGITLADAIAQRYSSGNPELILIIGTHWKTTGDTITLGCHRNHTGWY